ncbi:MAG: hypothetical protein ACE5H4_05235 [Candidatus Thorarchaeota archaeon]
MKPVDVGSFPLHADEARYQSGASSIEMNPTVLDTDDAGFFIETHNDVFRRKAEALGPETAVVCYAQCRGMIDQFFEPIFRYVLGEPDKLHGKIVSQETAQTVAMAIAEKRGHLPEKRANIAEIIALESGAEKLCKQLQTGRISYKACVTGPLELTLNFQRLLGFPRVYDDTLVEFFTEAVRAYVKNSHRNTKYLRAEIVTVDEPSIGLEGLADFFSDTGTDAKLNHLLSCWNRIFDQVPGNCYRGLHLHTSPFEQLFHSNWNLLEAHVGVYVKKEWLEDYDKSIRAALMRTDGPTIPKGTDLKAAWEEIRSGNYEKFLQPLNDMTEILSEYVEMYGLERVPFAGPECGLGPWDWPHGDTMALRNLENIKRCIRDFGSK